MSENEQVSVKMHVLCCFVLLLCCVVVLWCVACTVCSTQEHEKIMYYYPESENLDNKIRTVGLTSAIIGFAQ